MSQFVYVLVDETAESFAKLVLDHEQLVTLKVAIVVISRPVVDLIMPLVSSEFPYYSDSVSGPPLKF